MKKKYLFTLTACTAILTCMNAVSAFADEVAGVAQDAAAEAPAGLGWSSLLFPMILLLVFLWVMSMPQKKKEKEAKAMQESISVGDEVVTIGGIIGLVVRKGDDNVVIETAGDKTKLRIKTWAISENVTNTEKAAAVKEAAKKQRVNLTTGGEKADSKDSK